MTTQTAVTNDTQPTERRDRTRKLIEHILSERQHLLVSLCELAELPQDIDETAVRERVKGFCETLVDYVAAGHFELYEQIESRTERRRPVIAAAEQLYPKFEATTQDAVAFNDKYVPDFSASLINNLSDDLSVLGESLARRLELEDVLFETMVART